MRQNTPQDDDDDDDDCSKIFQRDSPVKDKSKHTGEHHSKLAYIREL